jgi:hypothetical protein
MARPGFAAGCGDEAERLEIVEPAGERLLDQARRQRRRLAPAADPDQRQGLWLALSSWWASGRA